MKDRSQITPAFESRAQSPMAKLVIGGSVTWTFELFCGHPIEFLKISKQTSGYTYPRILRDMVTRSWWGALDGFFPWGSLQCLVKGATFSFGQALGYSMLEGRLSEFNAQVCSGGIGGGIQGAIMSPLLLLKTRVMTDPTLRNTSNMWDLTKRSTFLGAEVVRHEGVAALFKGSFVFSLKRVGDWTSRFYFAETITNLVQDSKLKGQKLSFVESSMCSLVGGALSATVTLPVDVMVSMIQDAKKAKQRVSVFHIWKSTIREQGITGWLRLSSRGYIARVAHVGLTTLLLKTGTSAVYNAYFGATSDKH